MTHARNDMQADALRPDTLSTGQLAPWKRAVVGVVLATFILQPAATLAQITAAAGATVVTAAPNNVPLINIAAPTASGVSRNQYTQFDVDRAGAILNNSQTNVQTQLGGWVPGNANLAGGPARVILNEVTSALPSNLNGYLEVAGSKAEVIVANHNGITCNGCGFINTSRGVLTTGTPVFGGSGSLDAFRVTGGNIAIQGDGLNTTATDQVDLIARSVGINAKIWANNLNVIAGANQVNYADLGVQVIQGDANQPTVAIDVAVLGGMYANKIRLVGTEAGVGVVNAGEIAAQASDLDIDSAGRITLTGKAHAGGNLSLTGASLDLAGATTTADNAVTLTATAGAIDHSDALLQAGGQVAITATGAVVNRRGTVQAGKALTLNAGSLDNTAGRIVSLNADGLSIATQGQLTNAAGTTATGDPGGVIGGNGSVTLTAGNLTNSGTIAQMGTGAMSVSVGNTLDNTGGILQTNATDLSLSSVTLVNDGGTIAHAGSGTLDIQTGRLSNRGGAIGTNGSASVGADSIDNRGGAITAQGTASVTSRSTIDNSNAGTFAADRLTVSAQGAINNAGGTLDADNGLSLTAQSLANAGGRVRNLVSGDLGIAVSQGLTNTQSGLIAGNGTLTIGAGSVTNDGGTLYAKGNLALQSTGAVSNQSGLIQTDGDLNVTTGGTLDNASGRIEANGATSALTVAADTLVNTAGRVVNTGSGKTTVTATTRIDNSGTLGGNGDVEIDTASLTNSGSVLAGNDLQLEISTLLDNTGGKLYAAGDLSIDQSTLALQNAQGNIGASGNLNLRLASLANQGGTMAAALDLNLALTGVAALTGVGSIIAGNDATFSLVGDYINVAGNQIAANHNLTVNATGTLTNQGTLQAVGALSLGAADIDNQAGAVIDSATTTLTATNAITNAGRIEGNTLVTGSATLTNTGTLIGDSLTLTAGTLANQGAAALIAGTSALNLYVGSASNTDGANLYSAGNMTIAANVAGARANYLLNEGATIQAAGNLGIAATTIDNRRQSVVTTDVQVSSSGGRTCITCNNTDFPNPTWQDATTTVTETRLASATPEARILSGGDMAIDGTVLNNANSTVAAGGSLTSTASLNNVSTNLLRTTTNHVVRGYCAWGWNGSVRCSQGAAFSAITSNTTTVTSTAIGTLPSLIGGNQSIAATGATFSNRNVSPAGLDFTSSFGVNADTSALGAGGNHAVGSAAAIPGLTLPTNGLYTYRTAPGQHYLIETDPRFANYGNFISSDYMLAKLPVNTEATQKLIGDGFYQQQLIANQILTATGRTYIDGFTNTQAEYRALMDAGVAAAGQFKLTVGIALTAAQVAALTRDIVWMVEQNVTLGDGSSQQVLVPVVYLTAAHISLKPNGAVVAANTLDIAVTGNATNSGTLTSDTSTALSAGTDLTNRGLIQSQGDVTLVAGNDLLNQSGTVGGRNVSLSAGRDLVNERIFDVTQSNGVVTKVIHADAAIAATDGLTIQTGRDLSINAASVTTGGAATLAAGRNLTVQSVADVDSRGDASFGDSRTTQITSTVQAGTDLTLAAGADARLTAAKVEAGNDLTLAAGGQVTVEVAKDVVSWQYASSVISGSSTSETVKGSTLTAGRDITLAAGLSAPADLMIAASTVTGKGSVTLAGSGTIGILTEQQNTAQSSARWGAKSQEQSTARSSTAIGSVVQAGTDLSLTANAGSLVVQGSALDAGNTLKAQVAGDLQLLAGTSTKYQAVQSSQVTRREAKSLSAELNQTRLLLSSITAGNGVDLQVGGNLVANVGTKDAQGNLQADTMTANGVVKGSDRQQVSVGGSGSTAGTSQMVGNLAAQGIRSGASDSFGPGATTTGQAAVTALLQSGLVSVRNQPAIQAILATPAPNGSAMTYKDDSGKVQLTLAGQAKVQAVYSQLRLTETFNVTKFPDAGLAQVATLAAAIALTVMSGGSASGIGMALVGETGATVTAAAAMANAAAIGMASTMVGQMAGGANFADAFAAGVKAGATSALTAGIGYEINQFVNGPATAAPSTLQAGTETVQAGTNAAGSGLTNLQRMGTAAYWQQTALNATAQGAISTLEGGSFKDGFTGSVVGSLVASGAGIIGDNTKPLSLENIVAHAALGCVGAAAGGKGCASGALGGATSAIAAPLIDGALSGAGIADTTRKAIIGAGSVLTAGVVAGAAGKDTGVAAGAAANEVMNNYLKHDEAVKLEAAKTRLSGCAAGDAACRQSAQTDIDGYTRLSAQRDDTLRTTCAANPASAACQIQIGLTKEAAQTYQGLGIPRNSALGDWATQAARMADTPNYQPQALKLLAARIGMPVAAVGTAAAVVTAADIVGFCAINPVTCNVAGIAVSELLAGQALPTGVGVTAAAKVVSATSVAASDAKIANNFYRDGAAVEYGRAFNFQPGRTLAAEEANARTVAYGNNALNPQMPYARGTLVTERLAQPGEKLFVVELRDAESPGMWAAQKQYTSLEQARQELALLPEFKSGDLVVREYTVVRPAPVREGVVGSLKSQENGQTYAGGGRQTEFVFDVKQDWESYLRRVDPQGTPIR